MEKRKILSPLRLPVPPRPLWSSDQMLSQIFGSDGTRPSPDLRASTFKQAGRCGKASKPTSRLALGSGHIRALLDCLNMKKALPSAPVHVLGNVELKGLPGPNDPSYPTLQVHANRRPQRAAVARICAVRLCPDERRHEHGLRRSRTI